MLKGVLALLLLSTLSRSAGYGYGIITELRGGGFPGLAEGTVYPALARLEGQGLLDSFLVRSASGPARKYYRTTAEGLTALEGRAASWRELVSVVQDFTADRRALS